ncbi:MAG: hypothetical protein J6Z49_09790 [Kiritimatiellae bacterium]|nr:hypothetical protein [Kiritimatiellia bacterium]
MTTVANIVTPENGVYTCRKPDGVRLRPGSRCLATLDYGVDCVTFRSEETADSPLPTFLLLRELREADGAILAQNEEIASRAREAFDRVTAGERGGVRALRSRLSFGRERLFIRYTAQMPLDLRRYAGELGRAFHTQFHFWQVSAREEAALLGCVGVCGRKACCCSWQQTPPPVTIKMAKEQAVSLQPAAINGICGKLKCCLAFENEAGAGTTDKEDTGK